MMAAVQTSTAADPKERINIQPGQMRSENLESTPSTVGTDRKGCKYHPGQVSYRKWTCCNGFPMSAPCHSEKTHTERVYAKGEIEANWKFFETPHKGRSSRNFSAAVAIDCEMGTAETGESELIRVSVIDYFSGKVLLDSLVWPEVQMKHYNTPFSGITRQAMQNAWRQRTCLFGRSQAREAVWRHVGPDTIVVGHACNSDLTSLRWMHRVIIDTLIIEDTILRAEREEAAAEKVALEAHQLHDPSITEAAAMSTAEKGKEGQRSMQEPTRGLSLKSLARDHLNRTIQVKGRGHDSVEDALATRDILHWHFTNRL